MIARTDVPGIVLFSGEAELTQTAYEEYMMFDIGNGVEEDMLKEFPEMPETDGEGVLLLNEVQAKLAFVVLNRKASRDGCLISEQDEELRDIEILSGSGFNVGATHIEGLRLWLNGAMDDHVRTHALLADIVHHLAESKLLSGGERGNT